VPSPRAQTLQVLQAASAFVRSGLPTRLVHASRRDAPGLVGSPAGAEWASRQAALHTELSERFALDGAALPEVIAAPSVDWIDRVPIGLQFLPARAQELSFARSAAALVAREASAADLVLTRELEVADRLRRRPRTFLELHRVPEGRTRRRWLVRALGPLDVDPPGTAPGARIEAAHARITQPGLTGLIAISGGVAEDVLQLVPEAQRPALRARTLVAHDAFDPARFTKLPTRDEACRTLGLDPERPVVVYTGGLLAWKGVEVLIDAASELGDGVQVVIAGGMDADVERIRRYAAGLGAVRIDGYQPAGRVPLYLAAADVGVVPNRSRPAISARYTSPLKVFEAKAVGLPLVASDLPSLREVLGEDEAVFVAPDDAHALAAGIQRLLGDGPDRARRSARMRALAPEHTWDARAARILDWMYAQVAARST